MARKNEAAEEQTTEKRETAPVTRILAEHVVAADLGRFPPAARDAFRRALVDYVACVCAGAALPYCKAVRYYARSCSGKPIATVIADATKLSPPDAAFANGTAAHALDFDDGHREGSAHPGGVVFSAALATAEAEGSDWASFEEAVIAGYDVMLRIAATIHPVSAARGWHNSSVAGVFGAAAATGRLLGLDGDRMADAFGLSASFAGGIREYLFDGSDVKRLHLGKAARDGLVCANLAAHDVTGARRALEGEFGLLNAVVGGEGRIDRLTEGLETSWEISSVYFKPYPCCRHFQAAIDAVLKLKAERPIALQDIRGISIGLYAPAVPGHDHIAVTSLLDAQMSAPCAVVAALMHESVGARHFEPAAFAGAEAAGLLQAASVYADDQCTAEYPQRRTAVVALTMADGTTLQCRIRDPRGEAENPLSREELSRKFLENVGPVLGQAPAEDMLADIWADAFADQPVAGLTARLVAPEARA